MQIFSSRCLTGLAILICGASRLVASSDALPSLAKQGIAQKPVWLSDVSLGIKESYDDNVFASGAAAGTLPGYVIPSGSVAALEGHSSWVTTVSPKVGFNFAPLIGSTNLEMFSLGYAPDFAIYHDERSESYEAHRFITAIKARANTFSASAENTFSYIDGNDMGPVYPGSFCSAYGTSIIRERREQIQDRAKIAFCWDLDRCFIRPTASLLYYDLMTKHLNVPGYQNYSDRSDVNGGLDFGYKITPPVALTLGYRFGHQEQEKFSFSPYSSPSDYHRVLFGMEGKPLKWLKIEFQMGPDFRSYPEDTATRITPVDDKNLTTFYGEAAVTADMTAKDILTFKCRQFQWVSSTGKVPYFDSTYDLNYLHKLTGRFAFNLGARLLSSDYNSGNLPTCQRDDLQYILLVGMAYTVNSHVAFNAGYAADLGRNAQENIASPSNREFNRNIISLGLVLKW